MRLSRPNHVAAKRRKLRTCSGLNHPVRSRDLLRLRDTGLRRNEPRACGQRRSIQAIHCKPVKQTHNSSVRVSSLRPRWNHFLSRGQIGRNAPGQQSPRQAASPSLRNQLVGTSFARAREFRSTPLPGQASRPTRIACLASSSREHTSNACPPLAHVRQQEQCFESLRGVDALASTRFDRSRRLRRAHPVNRWAAWRTSGRSETVLYRAVLHSRNRLTARIVCAKRNGRSAPRQDDQAALPASPAMHGTKLGDRPVRPVQQARAYLIDLC